MFFFFHFFPLLLMLEVGKAWYVLQLSCIASGLGWAGLSSSMYSPKLFLPGNQNVQ